MGKNSFSKYRRLAKRRVQIMVSAEAHAFIVGYATKRDITLYQAATELVLTGVAQTAAQKVAEAEKTDSDG